MTTKERAGWWFVYFGLVAAGLFTIAAISEATTEYYLPTDAIYQM